MEKFKVCPFCGKRNVPVALECEECETDLSTVRVVDEEVIKKEVEVRKATTEQDSRTERVRICEECGFANPANARKCQSCGEDISDVLPTEATSNEKKHFILSSLDGVYAYQLQEGKTVIGREETMADYLSSKCFVSRKHAQLVLENGRVTIENYSKTNFTYVNNEKITDSIVELHDGDIIGLGGNEKDGKRQDNAAYFMMRIGTCI